MKHSVSKRDGCDSPLNALLWSRDFLNAHKEIAERPQTQAQTLKSTMCAEKTPTNFSLSSPELEANYLLICIRRSLSHLFRSLDHIVGKAHLAPVRGE